MLKLVGITKSFGAKEVLHQIDFEVKPRTVVGLLGPNGAGKTTLMRIIVGFYRNFGGRIFWDQRLIDPQDKSYKARIGYLSENNPLYLNLTVNEYLLMVAKLKGTGNLPAGPPAGRAGRQVGGVIKDCGLEEYRGAIIETLSRGFRQRVGLAAALIGEPQLLILDEPTTGLDPKQIVEIRQLIKKLAKSKAVVLSTHILPEAKEVCDELWIINRGEMVMHEKTDKIGNLEKKFVELT